MAGQREGREAQQQSEEEGEWGQPESTISAFIDTVDYWRVVRDALRAHLASAGIATDVHYPVPDTQQAACPAASAVQPLPVTEQACQTALSLPCYPGMAASDADRVIAGVRSFMSTQGA